MIKKFIESMEINHNLNWPCIPDHPYRILIVGASGSGKSNVLLNVIKYQRKYILDLFIYKRSIRIKVSLLINEREKVWIKKINSKAFIDYSKTVDHVYENLEDYNPTKKRKV